MTLVQRLKNIIATLPPEHRIELSVGPTDYLDQPVSPSTPVAWGIDRHGRHFLTLCIDSVRPSSDRVSRRMGVITIFQRYTDADIVAQAQNNGSSVPFLVHEANAQDLTCLEELVRTGHTVLAGGEGVNQLSLVSPAVAVPPVACSWRAR